MRVPKTVEKRSRAVDFGLLEEKNDDGTLKKRTIRGQAIVFNELSVDLGGFREIILPEAVTRDTIQRSDIFMFINHERKYGILARSKFCKVNATLKIDIDEKGVYFEFDVPDNQAGNDIYESIKRGDVSECSFAFTVSADGGDEVQYDESVGAHVRKVSGINRIYDFSIVDSPAYESTSVEAALRSIDGYKSKQKEMIEARKRQIKIDILKRSLMNRYKLKK